MSAERPTAWVYSGVWAIVTSLFKVPRSGPSLPVGEGEQAETFHPARGYLGYLKFWFCLFLAGLVMALLLFWAGITASHPGAGLLMGPLFLFLMIAPPIVIFIAIHLRFDNMWYVLTYRSLRIRRGIWIITEMTFTFENIQNVKVKSGPLQRAFGIADVIVETAAAGQDSQGHKKAVSNQGIIEGIADAPRIRDAVMSHVRRSKSSGLGDEGAATPRAATPAGPAWTAAHLQLLRDIRDELAGDYRL